MLNPLQSLYSTTNKTLDRLVSSLDTGLGNQHIKPFCPSLSGPVPGIRFPTDPIRWLAAQNVAPVPRAFHLSPPGLQYPLYAAEGLYAT